MTELAKQINGDLYPDVSAAGSLSNALGQALAAIGSPLQCASEINFIPLARVEGGSRFCQMYIAAHERLFIFDFWTKGVGYGNGSCGDLNEAAQAIHYWINEEPDIDSMQNRFTFFAPTDQARSHEAGEAVDYQWQKLSARWAKYGGGFAHSPLPLIEAASKRPELRQLFPFTSMSSLHFSRTTGYPFTNDCPYAIPIGDGRFRAHRAGSSDVIGEGDAEEVVAILVANLPPDCGPAVEGTAEDLP